MARRDVQKAAEATRAEALAEAERKRAQIAEETAAYKDWQDRTLSGLKKSWTYPALLLKQDVLETVTWSKDVGWYTTGDLYRRYDVDGEAVWFHAYGNTAVVFASPALIDRWYRERWEGEKSDRSLIRSALTMVRNTQYWGCVGYDYAQWLAANIGEDAIAALIADERHYHVAIEGMGNRPREVNLRYLRQITTDAGRSASLYDAYLNADGVAHLEALGHTVTLHGEEQGENDDYITRHHQ